MADEAKAASPAKTETNAKSGDLVKARLLAKLYEQPIVDGNGKVTGYNRFTQGGIVYVDKDTFNALNEFKQSFEEVTD